MYEDLLKRIRDDHPVAWNTALDRVTAHGQWNNAFGSAAPVLYARHFGPGLLIADRMSGRVTAIHRDGSSTYPAPDQAVHLATEQNYTVVVHSPGHYDATTPTTRPTPHPAPTTRPETDESRPPTTEQHSQAMDIDDDRGHPGQDPVPALLSAGPVVGGRRTDGATAVTFLGRIPTVFHVAATMDAVNVNGRHFTLPNLEAERARFAHQPLKGELVGSKVRFTNAVGEWFESPLDEPARQEPWPAGKSNTVFGVAMVVPGVPADHPVGEEFPGWYARVVGADGRRVVEWSRTEGDGFTPEGGVSPYDEPAAVYKFRIATEKAERPFTDPPAPTGPQNFRKRVPELFYAVANANAVSVNGKDFTLPKDERHELFANKALRGERTGDDVTITNADGDSFKTTLGRRLKNKGPFQPGSRNVFGMKLPVPEAPADHPVGEAFPGWYPRLAGVDGHRVVEWSRTEGDGFTPEGDVTPFDEPTAEYKYRIAREEHARRSAADPAPAARPGTDESRPPAPEGDGQPMDVDDDRGHPDLHPDPDPTPALLPAPPAVGGGRTDGTTAVTFLGRVPKSFYVAATMDGVNVNGRHFTLPSLEAERARFAHQPLKGERIGSKVRFTNAVGERFESPLDEPARQEPWPAGTTDTVFGVQVSVPGVPADHPVGEEFPGWYARVVGADGRRVVEWSRTEGEGFTPEGEVSPYDEPAAVYEFRIATEKARRTFTDQPAPTGPQNFRECIPELFYVTSRGHSVSVNGKEFTLPKGERLALFANKALMGVRTGDKVTVTNADGDSFKPTLGRRLKSKVPFQPGSSYVFGMRLTVPDAPADHPVGEAFPGWYPRLAGVDGHRVVEWSRTEGDGFTPEGDVTPFDEPTAEYEYRIAAEKAETRARAADPVPVAEPGAEPTGTDAPRSPAPEGDGQPMDVDDDRGHPDPHPDPDPTPALLSAGPVVGGGRTNGTTAVTFLGRVPKSFDVVAAKGKVNVNGRQFVLPKSEAERARFAHQPLKGEWIGSKVRFTNVEGQWFEKSLDEPTTQQLWPAGKSKAVFGVKMVVPGVPADHPVGEEFPGWYARVAVGDPGRRVVEWSRTGGDGFTPEGDVAPYDEPVAVYKDRLATEQARRPFTDPSASTGPQDFRERIPELFYTTANAENVGSNSRTFTLPTGERTGDDVTITNADGDAFDATLGQTPPREGALQPGGQNVAGVWLTVPGAPADHPVGEAFPGWYARVVGDPGRRVVEWSRTEGDGFTPEGDVTPFDEPTAEYEYRIAAEEAETRARAADPVPVAEPGAEPTGTDGLRSPAPEGEGHPMDVDDDRGHPDRHPDPDPTPALLPAPPAVAGGRTDGTTAVTFLARLPKTFHVAAAKKAVTVNGREFKLLGSAAERARFAHQPLTGEIIGSKVRFTNAVGEWFDKPLDVPTTQQLCPAGKNTTVFGVKVSVPEVPADHPVGEEFPGWYARVVGDPGRRVVEWSR
ncbi:hypothetical protein AB0K51_34575, partial [Kitasatospora sp. NPDC049285]